MSSSHMGVIRPTWFTGTLPAYKVAMLLITKIDSSNILNDVKTRGIHFSKTHPFLVFMDKLVLAPAPGSPLTVSGWTVLTSAQGPAREPHRLTEMSLFLLSESGLLRFQAQSS